MCGCGCGCRPRSPRPPAPAHPLCQFCHSVKINTLAKLAAWCYDGRRFEFGSRRDDERTPTMPRKSRSIPDPFDLLGRAQ